MARFFGSITGQSRTTAHRLGSKKRGMSAHVRGWDFGVFITAGVDAKGEDTFEIDLTGGSNGAICIRHLGIFKLSDIAVPVLTVEREGGSPKPA